MTQEQENNDYNFINDSSETDLDGFMEMLLKNKKYETIKTVLDCISDTHDKYEYYLNKMTEARIKDDYFFYFYCL